uniref:Uncharacterized protein n=1 Tax=Spongospora subterranea TaxID=70186 RepID=A0A0H5QWN0_9EUKA|eukprot:CRZ06378.1 hypothetical protein [Spongospora subterranea]
MMLPVEDGDAEAWLSQRDRTVYLEDFEQFVKIRKMQLFVVLNHPAVAIDDQLYGTRAKDNQVNCWLHDGWQGASVSGCTLRRSFDCQSASDFAGVGKGSPKMW